VYCGDSFTGGHLQQTKSKNMFQQSVFTQSFHLNQSRNNHSKFLSFIIGIFFYLGFSIIAQLSAQNLAKFSVVDMPEASTDLSNREVAIAVSRSILQANWEELDKLLDDKFTYTGDGYVFTKDQYIGFMQDMRAAFSNFEMILDKSVMQGDHVSFKFVSHAVNTGKFMGAPANKKHLEVNGIFMRNVKNGKVIQEWQTTDLLGTMKQIGGGALFFYSVFVGGFNVQSAPPVRKPNDFLNINGNANTYDQMTSKQKNKYVKKYLKDWKKATNKK